MNSVPHTESKQSGKIQLREKTMDSQKQGPRSLGEIEQEVLAEGREWTRRRLQEKLQEEANRHGGVFPPQPKKDVAPTKGAHGTAHRRRSG